MQTAPRRIEKRRFVQNAAVSNQAFTLANGHDQFLTVTTVGGSAVPYVDSWRIKYIDFYLTAQEGFPSNLIVTPTGTDLTSNMNNDPEQLFSLTCNSPANPTHMRIVPSRFRPLGAWHFTSATNFAGTLFQMSVGIGGGGTNTRLLMDITFEVVPNLIGLPLGYSVSTASTTLGTIGGRNVLSGMFLYGVNNLG